MAKRSPLKVTILPKMANLAKTMKMAKIHQSLRKNSNEMTTWPFESGDFDENGGIGVNDEYGEHSPKS